MEADQSHPYVPRDLSLPGYVPCFLSQAEILVPYIGCSVFVVAAIWLISGMN
jgi:cholestenol Delta-isomerase